MRTNYRTTIDSIRFDYLAGGITLKEAKERIKPLLIEMNKIGKEVAKKHGMKFSPLTFSYVFR